MQEVKKAKLDMSSKNAKIAVNENNAKTEKKSK